jgi:peptidoglycan hydrolase-like protein with peptidoglycan-binding domain
LQLQQLQQQLLTEKHQDLQQQLLNQKGARIVVDQEFGAMTANAVRGFQSANGLGVDGVVGPRTAATLQSPTSKPVAAAPDQAGGGDKGGVEPKNVTAWRDRVISAA